MAKIQVNKTTSVQKIGGVDVAQEQVVQTEQVDPQEFTIAKLSQVVWFIGHLIATLLTLRFLFLVFGANQRGVVTVIYNLSELFIMPFRGIFPASQTGSSYFDTAALLAIIMYYLLILIVVSILQILSKKTDSDA